MTLRPAICLLLFLGYGTAFAQVGGPPEKSAFRNIEKHRWQKAEGKLRKTLLRDTLNPSIRYVFSVYYFHPENPDFDIDSAYRYVVSALKDYQVIPLRERDRLKRAGIDSLLLVNLRARIDSAAFEVAKNTNTETAYLEFLSHFPSAIQRDLAVQLRDEVAYQDALTQDTHQAFYSYITRYPDARRVPEAQAHYHRLLYLEETKDKRLSSYERFLREHPETPYRSEVYRNIFEISTADGSAGSFLSFMTRYPVSELANRAGKIVFHLLAEEDDPEWPPGFLSDSLQRLIDLNATYLVPFLKNDRYGFMDEHGREVIAARYRSIHNDYLCGHVTDEILIADNQLVARDGNIVFNGPISDVSDIGAGFLRIATARGTKVIHKSGFPFADSVEDVRALARSFIAVKKRGKWALYTLTGRLLDTQLWDDVNAIGDVIVFSREDRKFIVPKRGLGGCADGRALPLSEPFDDVKLWGRGLIWGKSGEYEGVLNQSLQSVIRFDKQQLTQTAFGALARTPYGYVLYDESGRKSTTFDEVILVGKKLPVKKNNAWFLFDPVRQLMEPRAYDSLRPEGAFAVGIRTDSVYIHFENDHVQTFFRPGRISFVPGRDSTSFLIVQEGTSQKSVFDLDGRKLFSATFDALEYAGKGLFVVTRKDRKGLLDMRGQTRLPAEYDAIGTVKDDVVSILKNKKFGAYNPAKAKLIKPQYDRNLIAYGQTSVVTFREGYHGFLDWDNKPLSAFEFEEVSYWNDSLALVKKGGLWSLFDLAAKKLVETNLRGISMIKDTPAEKIAIIQKENNFGVITSRGRIIIPPTFTEVINLGSTDAPLYFTEKHVPEASLYIVIYYDRTGEMLRKEIYDDPADYDKIYCSDK